jgi:hypothetical protein
MSSLYDVPVSPYTSDGNIASLAGVLTKSVPAAPPPTPPYNYGVVTLSSTSLSASMTASLGFQDLVSFQVSGNAYYWLVDVIAALPPIESESPVLSQVYGVGVRLALKAWNVNTKFSLSAYSFAAQATLSMAHTTFAVEAYGAGLQALSTMKPLLTVLGSPFDVEKFQVLGEVMGDLTDYLVAQGDNLTPVLLGVNLDFAGETLLDPAGGYVFALRRIAKGNSYNQALQSIPPNPPPDVEISSVIVQAVYDQLVGSDQDAQPSSAAKSSANQILGLGS